MSIRGFLNKHVAIFGREIPMKHLLLVAAGLIVLVLSILVKF